jgi:hypothetical protein
MSKLLRPLVILQLLLSIAAATFAWLLFDKREVLKGRVQNNEAAWPPSPRTSTTRPSAWATSPWPTSRAWKP